MGQLAPAQQHSLDACVARRPIVQQPPGRGFLRELVESKKEGRQFPLADLVRPSVYRRLAGYEDVNDAERLSHDPTFRLIGSEQIWERGAALTSRVQTIWGTCRRCSVPTNSAHRSISTPDETRKGVRTGPQQKCGAPYLYERRRLISKTFAGAGSTVVGLLAFWRYCSHAPRFALVLGVFTAATQLVPYG